VLDGWLQANAKGTRSGDITSTTIIRNSIAILCTRDVNGRLRDKPSRPNDLYHGCYNLSGLSVSQHALKPWPSPSIDVGVTVDDGKDETFNNLFGDTKTKTIEYYIVVDNAIFVVVINIFH